MIAVFDLGKNWHQGKNSAQDDRQRMDVLEFLCRSPVLVVKWKEYPPADSKSEK